MLIDEFSVAKVTAFLVMVMLKLHLMMQILLHIQFNSSLFHH